MIVVEELKNIYQDYEFLREGIQIILNKILIYWKDSGNSKIFNYVIENYLLSKDGAEK